MKRFNTKNNPTRQHKPLKTSVNQTSHMLKKGQFGLRSLQHTRVNINQVANLKRLVQKEIKILEKRSNLGKIKV